MRHSSKINRSTVPWKLKATPSKIVVTFTASERICSASHGKMQQRCHHFCRFR